MAVVTPTRANTNTTPHGLVVTWALDAHPTTDTYEAQEWSGTGDQSVQMVGAAGAGGFNGATVTIQGSNDGTNWQTLTNPLGTAITFTAAGLQQVSEITRYIRPSLSVATAGTTLTCILFKRQ